MATETVFGWTVHGTWPLCIQHARDARVLQIAVRRGWNEGHCESAAANWEVAVRPNSTTGEGLLHNAAKCQR